MRRYSAKFVKNVFKVINMRNLVGKTMINPPKRRNLTGQQLKNADLEVIKQEVDGFEVLTLLPEKNSRKHVFYLHGGGYALEASPFHSKIQEFFVNEYDLKVSFFDYPLAPENTVEKTLALTQKSLEYLFALYPEDDFYLFGDSAGGGLAMSLAQQLRNQRIERRPLKLALVSPWLDVSISDPRSEELQEKDVLLKKNLLQEAGANYAGELPVKDPKVSPIYGTFDDLGELFVIAGTDEILYPDVLRLKEKVASAQNTQLRLEIVEGMMHDFVVYPLKESLAYIKQIGAFYKRDSDFDDFSEEIL